VAGDTHRPSAGVLLKWNMTDQISFTKISSILVVRMVRLVHAERLRPLWESGEKFCGRLSRLIGDLYRRLKEYNI
jgi:hypothetical protein